MKTYLGFASKRLALFLVLLVISTAPAKAAMNVYVALQINGAEVSGQTTLHSIGGEDVSIGHIECYAVNHEIFKATPQGGSLTHTPFKLVKRVDKASPVLYRGLSQNQTVSATIKYFDTNPEDGTTQKFFTIELQNARISGVRHWSPNNMDPAGSSYPHMEEVSITYNSITIRDELTSQEHEISANPQAK